MDDKYLTLVNNDNMFNSSFLYDIDIMNYDHFFSLERETMFSFMMLRDYLLRNGIDMRLTNAFVSVSTQILLYRDALVKYSEKYVTDNYEEPLYTEHHTGLCFDFCIYDNGCFIYQIDDVKRKIILDAAFRLGFILRYPKGKENITGHRYEPNHLRYVGIKNADIINSNDLCLEEFINCKIK